MDEPDDSDNKRRNKKQHVPPGWMSFSAAMRHVQAALHVDESEADRLLLRAKNKGRIRFDLNYQDYKVYEFPIRIIGVGPRLFAPDVWSEFPPQLPKKKARIYRHPGAEPAILAALEWLDHEGEQQRALVERWIADWLTLHGYEEPVESTIRRWAADASERLRQRRASFEDRSSRGR
jgi:hypothetical protein